jgi:glycosyl transferase family 4
VKDLLVITYSFPPCGVTGTYRTLAAVKYLDPLGWRSNVLCAANPIYRERDEQLLKEVPATARVIRTRDVDLLAFAQRVYRLRPSQTYNANAPARSGETSNTSSHWRLFKREIALHLRPTNRAPGWYLSTLRAGRRVLRNEQIHAIYSSGPPWTAHLVALRLQRESGLPWVADFRDPWVADPFADLHAARFRERDLADESRVLAHANAVTCVLESMREDFLNRYPLRTPASVVTILNGFDPAAFRELALEEESIPVGSGAKLTILHAGQVYGKRRIEPLLSGLSEYTARDPAIADALRLQFLGGSEGQVAELQAKIQKAAVAPWVDVETEVPHAQALKRMANSTVLLLVGFTGPGEQFQMSGKIFEYLALRRPILALAPPSCPVGDVLRAAGVRHWIISPDHAEGIQQALGEIAEAWRQGRLAGPQSTDSLRAYNRQEQAKDLVNVLEDAIARKTPIRQQV